MVKARIAVSLVALMGSVTAWGQGQNVLSGGVRLLSEETDNARKTATDEFSERQDTLSANAAAIYTNDVVALDAQYSISNRRYDEDSQEERTSTFGGTNLRLGKEHNLFELLMSHSLQKVLTSAEAVNLDENSDERQILMAQPTMRLGRGSADTFIVRGTATDIDYRFEEERNSTRAGASAIWEHALSPVDKLAVVASHTDVEFDSAPQADYQMQVASINYSVQLRRLSYLIDLGQSRTESEEGADLSKPYYNGLLTYDTGYNQYKLAASQKISDSSYGIGASGIDDTGESPSDVGSANQEQMLVRLAEAGWETSMVCDRCSVSVRLAGSEREYLDITREERSVEVGIGFSYRISTASTLGVNVNRREQKFLQVAAEDRSDYTLDDVNMFYSYEFANSISARLLLSQEERASEELAREYKELRAGIALAYLFK